MLTLNQLSGFGIELGPWWESIFNNLANWDADSGGWDGHTIRVRVPNSLLTGSLSDRHSLRLTVAASSGEGFTFSKLYVGHAAGAGDAWDAASLVPVTFQGGQAGAVIPAGGVLVSDPVAFAYDGSSALIVSTHSSGGSSSDAIRRDTVLTGASYYWKSAVDEAATANASGYSTASNSLLLVQAIELSL